VPRNGLARRLLDAVTAASGGQIQSDAPTSGVKRSKEDSMTPPKSALREVQKLASHPETERIPLMLEPDYSRFRADVAARGIQVPIEITPADVVNGTGPRPPSWGRACQAFAGTHSR
jgi:hypothetical protein